MSPLGHFKAARLGQPTAEQQSHRTDLLRARISSEPATWSIGFFNQIKQCRWVAKRYDKLAANYLAFIQLASIRLWLCVNESTPYDGQPRNGKVSFY